MNNKKVLARLKRMRACPSSRIWVELHGGDIQSLWHDCKRGDWMVWYLAGRREYRKDPRYLAFLVDLVGRLARYTDEQSAKEAVKVLKAYQAGKATKKEVADASHKARMAYFNAIRNSHEEKVMGGIWGGLQAVAWPNQEHMGGLILVEKFVYVTNHDLASVAKILRKYIDSL